MLNAFRHHRLLRASVGKPILAMRCAQRLSASQIITQFELLGVGGFLLCSTPFGITDYYARTCRFQFGPFEGAQRLSASQIITRDDEVQIAEYW